MTNTQVIVDLIICAGFVATFAAAVWFVVLLVADVRARRAANRARRWDTFERRVRR